MDIFVVDVSALTFPQRLCAAALQGLVNRDGPHLFLDYGIYDDPNARRTNEIFLDDAIWFGKYRELLGNQDQRNLAYYGQAIGFQPHPAAGLDGLLEKYRERVNGCVVWEQAMPDSANAAIMLAALEDLLPVEAGMLPWAEAVDLPVRHDLRGRWRDRIELYRWAFTELFPKCKPGVVASVEPDWQRPEFYDTIIQNKIFTYSLSNKSGGLGDTLLLLLAFGPAWLCELVFALRLDGPVRRLGLALMRWRSAEVRLGQEIQRAVQAVPYPTIFGWHTRRDDELSFMLHLSANGLRLVPAHLAGNFSFHSQVKPLGLPAPAVPQDAALDPAGVYVTFTLSDGDQLMMMSTEELGNWASPLRGQVPFNWETQPLLVELAPALFEKYVRTATPNDCLVAGPSGAGYIIPTLAPDLATYMEESQRVCRKAGIRVVTFYVADPPAPVFRRLAAHSGGIAGYLGGYANLGSAPCMSVGEAMYVANQWPTLTHLWDPADRLLEGLRALIDAPGPKPRFIGVHLFAYRTTLEDVVRFSASLDPAHVHVVRGDTFLRMAQCSQAKPIRGAQNRE